jgi:hypothetical protein
MDHPGIKGFGIMTQFSLPDNALVIAEQELNGIFNGNNVSLVGLIEIIKHGCQCG